jgi:uncharacterized SAM-dependent methyltransferase
MFHIFLFLDVTLVMTAIHLNEIIRVFLQRNVIQLISSDVSVDIEANGTTLSTTEIYRVVNSLGSSLFHLRDNNDDTFFIRINPTVSSYNYFLMSVMLCFRLIYVKIFITANALCNEEDAISFMCVVTLIVV